MGIANSVCSPHEKSIYSAFYITLKSLQTDGFRDRESINVVIWRWIKKKRGVGGDASLLSKGRLEGYLETTLRCLYPLIQSKYCAKT
jgi:hypothetical protein